MTSNVLPTRRGNGRTLRIEKFEGRLVLSSATAADPSGELTETVLFGDTSQVASTNLASLVSGEGGIIRFELESYDDNFTWGGFDTDQIIRSTNGQTDHGLIPGLTNGNAIPNAGSKIDFDDALNLGIGERVRPFPNFGENEGEGGPIGIAPPFNPSESTAPAPPYVDPEPEPGNSREAERSIAKLIDRPLENVRVRAFWLEVAATTTSPSDQQRDMSPTSYSEVPTPQSERLQPQTDLVALQDNGPPTRLSHPTEKIPADRPSDGDNAKDLTKNPTPTTTGNLPAEQKPLSQAAWTSPREIKPTNSDQAARSAAFAQLEPSSETLRLLEALPVGTEQQHQTSTDRYPHLYGAALVALLSADHFLRRHSQSEPAPRSRLGRHG